jgi:hypothetical protein
MQSNIQTANSFQIEKKKETYVITSTALDNNHDSFDDNAFENLSMREVNLQIYKVNKINLEKLRNTYHIGS